MLSSLPKRPASSSPARDRPSKRQATSSPEEGELDDASPPSVARLRSPSPSKPAKSTAKIPFPFKKKLAAQENGSNGAAKDRSGGHERDDERRYRDEDNHRRYGLPPRPDDRNTRSWGADSWEPGPGRYDRPRWEAQSYVPDSRAYPRSPERRPYRSPTPPRHRDIRPVSRSRSPPSPRSRSVRSPSSPRSPLTPSSGKEKHRLPPSRPVVPDPETYRPLYERDRWPEDDDRWGHRRSPVRYENYRDSREDALESYAAKSPTARLASPPRLISPRATPSDHSFPEPAKSPPPPFGLPPPAPPLSSSLPPRPPTPVNAHSPQLIATYLPRLESEVREAAPPEHHPTAGPSKPTAARRPKRKPVHRTREEEEEAYGRTFVGCGQQSDYTVLTKLGEGTFGEVHKAQHRLNGTAVALKRILMHNEKEGMPVTALREIKILKALRHPCIVDILDMFVVRSHGKESPLSVYMVFPYMDHDLAGLLENERVKLTPSQIKLYMKQLLEGTEYMHRNHILHRDMKAANLLISNDGSLKIADFGLARAFDPSIVRVKEDAKGRERKYTNCVVTRWYRPPELLLGARQYGGEVDMWGVGCVLGEMFFRKPILPGASDLDQLDKIWQLCGTPTPEEWPEYDLLPGCEGVKNFASHPRRLRKTYDTIGHETVDLLDKLMVCNPRKRLTAAQALDHDYFWTDPLPADPKSLPSYEASHEFDKRGRRHQAPAGAPIHPPAVDGLPRPMPPLTGAGMHGRPPPPRESFRNGPPPAHYLPPTGGMAPGVYGTHAPAYQPAQRYPPVPAVPPPATLPPIIYRPGQPVPQILPQAPAMPQTLPPPPVQYGRGAPHLPARPPMPLGRTAGARPGGGYGGGGELNYG
ncbi:Pkinase-domain-containing protein [Polyporus arcularius HHB13444]|uniref:Pkinase-domain-containing protein n=1 Tax=Polyporus arcularius HHB13444 TaxID=1314778 RepID=A0A5C3PBP5_9APHY|nr:Pkinase-domain-containing protein [Polyporus arcularius HHB13444]